MFYGVFHSLIYGIFLCHSGSNVSLYAAYIHRIVTQGRTLLKKFKAVPLAYVYDGRRPFEPAGRIRYFKRVGQLQFLYVVKFRTACVYYYKLRRGIFNSAEE